MLVILTQKKGEKYMKKLIKNRKLSIISATSARDLHAQLRSHRLGPVSSVSKISRIEG